MDKITESLSDDERGSLEAEVLFMLDTGDHSISTMYENFDGKYTIEFLRLVQSAMKSELGVE